MAAKGRHVVWTLFRLLRLLRLVVEGGHVRGVCVETETGWMLLLLLLLMGARRVKLLVADGTSTG
jgi:hypothetical protein